MPCPRHMVHYTTCGHFRIDSSSQPSSCDHENCEDHWPRVSYLPGSCPECSTESDSLAALAAENAKMEINITKRMPESVDDKQKSTSKTPSESETESSFPDNCECSNSTMQYEGCNHTIQTIHRTGGCDNECATKYSNDHVVPGACPDCSAHSRLKGNDEGNLHGPLEGCMSTDSLMRLEIEKITKKLKDQASTANSVHDGNTKKVEVANNDLKKFIAALTLARPIKAIFADAEQVTAQAHEVSWELEANQLFLRLETAARAGMDSEVDTLKQSFLDEGEHFKNEIKTQLQMVKEGVLKQCEAGVKQMLEAFEDSSLEDAFPSSLVY